MDIYAGKYMSTNNNGHNYDCKYLNKNNLSGKLAEFSRPRTRLAPSKLLKYPQYLEPWLCA